MTETAAIELFTGECQTPHFEDILSGLKSVEGRRNKDKWSRMKAGDYIQIAISKKVRIPTWDTMKLMTSEELVDVGYGIKFFVAKITTVNLYTSVKVYLEGEGLNNCLPHISEMEDGVTEYEKYFPGETHLPFVAIRLHALKVEEMDIFHS
jgi:ASC-1-like (ASCH) protein